MGASLRPDAPTCALVGFGAIARSTHLSALAQAGCRVVAIAEVDAGRRAIAERCCPDAQVFADLPALLAACRPTFVDICSPPGHHLAALELAAAAGVHALCEKPLVVTQGDAARVAEIVRARGVVVGCVHNWLEAPILARLQALVAAGEVGRVQRLEAVTLRRQPAAGAAAAGNWRCDPRQAGGGILVDHGWHALAILRRLSPAPTAGISARLVDYAGGERVEHTAEVELSNQDGSRGRVYATWRAASRHNHVLVAGSQGTVVADNDTLRLWHGDCLASHEQFDESLADGGYRPTWTAQVVRRFLGEVRGRAAAGTMLAEAREVIALIDAAYSAATHEQQRGVPAEAWTQAALAGPDPVF